MTKRKRYYDNKDLPRDNPEDQIKYEKLLDQCFAELIELRGCRSIVARKAGVKSGRINNFISGQDLRPPIHEMERILKACEEVKEFLNN